MNKYEEGFLEAIEENIDINSISFIKGIILAILPLKLEEISDNKISKICKDNPLIKFKLNSMIRRLRKDYDWWVKKILLYKNDIELNFN